MTRTEELLALAKAATQFDWTRDSEGWVNHCDNWEAQDFIAAANPENIKQLVELCRLQHEALKEYTGVCRSHNDPNDFTPRVIDEGFYARDAIAAFEKFEGGE